MKSKKVKRLSKKVSNTFWHQVLDYLKNQRNKRIEKIERRKNEM